MANYNMHLYFEIYKGKDDDKHTVEKNVFDVVTLDDCVSAQRKIAEIVSKYKNEYGFYHKGYIFSTFGYICKGHRVLGKDLNWLAFAKGINSKSKLLWFQNMVSNFVLEFIHLATSKAEVSENEN